MSQLKSMERGISIEAGISGILSTSSPCHIILVCEIGWLIPPLNKNLLHMKAPSIWLTVLREKKAICATPGI
jgi:hypothetical protein